LLAKFFERRTRDRVCDSVSDRLPQVGHLTALRRQVHTTHVQSFVVCLDQRDPCDAAGDIIRQTLIERKRRSLHAQGAVHEEARACARCSGQNVCVLRP